ncbi:hypothetical protein D7231_35010, partial [Streptomyces klenkii]
MAANPNPMFVFVTTAGPDLDERAATAAAHARLSELADRSDDSAPHAPAVSAADWRQAWQALSDATRRTEFTFTTPDMIECQGAMYELGMLTDEHEPVFPDPEAFGVTARPKDPRRLSGIEATAADALLTPAERAFLAAYRAALTTDQGEPGISASVPGIPAYVFDSPMIGWHVSPRQIEAALNAYHGADEKDREAAWSYPWWDQWIAFLRRAKDRNG